jgi:hypothetical protein
MINRSILALAIVLTFSGLVWAQPGPEIGTYDMEWSILHVPVSSDMPDLQTGTVPIQLERVMPGDCPPSSAFIVRNAPKFSLAGDATTTWCIKPDGAFDTSAGTMSSGGWFQYTPDVAYVDGKNTRANDTTNAVGRRQATPPPPPPPPPPPSTLKVFITQPRNNDTVSGTAWVVIWVEGTSGSSNVFTLSADGTQVGTQPTSSRGPVTVPWDTRSVINGTHTLTATVRDAQGNTGTTSITVIVRN